MESKKINQLATELAPELSDLTIIGDPTTGISKKITLSQMASLFTGTVEEYANLASFPLVGTADTIYIALDTNIIYRWNTGTSAYVELSPNIVTSLVFNDANGFDGTISLVGSTATLTITTALTQGSIGFIGASGALTQDNSNFFWDNTNKRLGINTNAPTTAIDAFGSGIIGRLNGTSTNNAFLGFASAGSNKWSIGNVQSDHRFRIYSEANTAELVSVLQTGEVGIGIANPLTKLHIFGGASALIANLDANTSVAKSISFRSGNSSRINLEVSGTESGSDAGADLFIRRYSDAGALIDTALYLKRSNGWFGIGYITPSSIFDIRDTSTTNTTSSLIIGSKYAATGGADYAGTSGIEFKHYGTYLGATWRNGGKIISTRLANYSDNSLANSALDFYTTNQNTDAIGMRLNNSGNLGLGVDLTTISLSYLLNVNASGIGGVAEVARFAARGNGGTNRGTGILIGAPGSSSIVNVARLVGYQNAASATADSAAFTIEVANTSGTLTERIRLNSIGQMSVGSTISNWDNTLRVIQIGEAGNFFSGFNGGSAIYAGSGAYYNAGWKYASASTGVNLIDVGDGNFLFRSAAAGTIGNTITWIDRMKIGNDGNVGINSNNTYSWRLRVVGVTTTNSSYGAEIVGGTSNLDAAFAVRNMSDVQLFYVRGDGLLVSRPLMSTHTTSSGANMYVDPSNGAIYRSTSSIKYKKNVQDYTKGLDELMKLRTVTYEGKNEIDNGRIFAGLIAEEVHDLGLTEYVQYAEDGTPDALAYQNMVAILIKGVQELKAELDILKNK